MWDWAWVDREDGSSLSKFKRGSHVPHTPKSRVEQRLWLSLTLDSPRYGKVMHDRFSIRDWLPLVAPRLEVDAVYMVSDEWRKFCQHRRYPSHGSKVQNKPCHVIVSYLSTIRF